MRTAPFIAVLDPQHHGKPISFTPGPGNRSSTPGHSPVRKVKLTQVDVYSADEEVELFVNGVIRWAQTGRRCRSRTRSVSKCIYQPGTIEAVGYTGGKETGRHRLVTASTPSALHLTPDRPVIQAGGGDLAYVTIEIRGSATV